MQDETGSSSTVHNCSVAKMRAIADLVVVASDSARHFDDAGIFVILRFLPKFSPDRSIENGRLWDIELARFFPYENCGRARGIFWDNPSLQRDRLATHKQLRLT